MRTPACRRAPSVPQAAAGRELSRRRPRTRRSRRRAGSRPGIAPNSRRPASAADTRTSSATAGGQGRGRVDDAPRRAGRTPGAAGRRPSAAAELPQPVAQVGHPAQRPLGGRALDDEVAGEPAPGAAVPVGVLAGAGGVRRLAQVGPALRPRPRRAPASRGRASVCTTSPRSPARAASSTSPIARGIAAGQPRQHPAALAAGAAVHGAEDADLGLGPGRRRRPAVDHALVQVGRPRRLGHRARRRSSRRAPAARAGRRRPRPAASRRRPRRPARTWTGTDSAPPPVDAQRPVTTPPGRNQGRNRPSRAHVSSQLQPLAAISRASFLYSSSAGMPGWSSCSRVQDRVSATGSPARLQGPQQLPGRVGVQAGRPKAARTSAASRSSTAGR